MAGCEPVFSVLQNVSPHAEILFTGMILWYNSRKAAVIPALPIERYTTTAHVRLWYHNREAAMIPPIDQYTATAPDACGRIDQAIQRKESGAVEW